MKTALSVVIWLFVVMLSARVADNWRMKAEYADLLPPEAVQALQLQAPLRIEVFARPDSVAASLVNNFLQPVLAWLPASEVHYIDIEQQPELRQSLGIEKLGEMRIHRGDAVFQLSTLSYEAFFNGLMRLSQSNDQWVVFLEGQGGKSFSASAAHGYAPWLKALQQVGYRVAVLPWTEGLVVPSATGLLILPAPVETVSHTQREWLEQQIQSGISVLWLTDPLLTQDQPELALLFDVVQTAGYHQGQLVLKSYPDHPVNEAFDRPLDLVGVMPYETLNDVMWVNEQQQTLASTREWQQSRMMVIGDSDFVSAGQLHSGGNLEMSYRLIDWLLHTDDRLVMPSIGSRQAELYFAAREVLILAGLMLILVPVLMLILAVFAWRRHRRG